MIARSVNLTVLSLVIAGRDEINLLPHAFRWSDTPQGHSYWLRQWYTAHITIRARQRLQAIKHRALADNRRHGSTYHEVNYPRPMKAFQ